MFVRVIQPTTIDGLAYARGQIVGVTGAQAIPLIKSGAVIPRYGIAPKSWTEPDDEEFKKRKQRAKEQGQDVDWLEKEKARRKNKPHAGFVASTSQTTNPYFLAKMREAIAKYASKSPWTRQAAAERAEKERARWRNPQRRQRGKGD
jgi:hypothetical protein